MIPILLGTALALVALGFVLYPLVRADFSPTASRGNLRVPEGHASTAIDALREIEFDHVTGKLSEHDYNQLKAAYTERAIASMRAESGVTAEGREGGTEAETIICPSCGPRPEGNAAFCSECGRALTL